MTENLDVFFCGLDQVDAYFEITNGATHKINGYFDNAFYDSSVGETVLDTTQPRFTCRFSEVRHIPREAKVAIGGELYSVIQIQPEGTGLATVLLAHE